MGTRYLNEGIPENAFLEDWTKSLAERGIKAITGSIIVDASEFGYHGTPNGWNWGDIGNYYGAGPSGIIINDNILNYEFKTGKTGSMSTLTKTQPELNGFYFDNQIVSGNHSSDRSLIYGAPYSNDRFGTGSLPANRNQYIVKGSLPDPEVSLGMQFSDFLIANGIPASNYISAKSLIKANGSLLDYSQMELAHTHLGNPLIEIINKTNERSINLFAEQMVSLMAYEAATRVQLKTTSLN